MAFLRKVKAGLVKADFDSFVGEEGNIFFNVETGELRLSNGKVVGGIPIGGGTSSPLTVSLIDGTNTVSSPLTNITAIRFDTDSGFDITDLGSGAVKVGMNSTFKTWKVDGQQDLVATGLDTIKLVAGSGIELTTDPNGNPYKTLTIKTIDKTVKLYQDGNLVPTVGTVRWHTPGFIKISKVTARLANAPSTDLLIKIKKSGTIAETLIMPTSLTKATGVVDIDMIEDDYLTVDVDFDQQYPGGTGLSVEFTYSFL